MIEYTNYKDEINRIYPIKLKLYNTSNIFLMNQHILNIIKNFKKKKILS